MAKNDDGFYHTLRLSRRNPNHIRMHQILVDLDKSVYKSQNQFIVDAVEFYINALEGRKCNTIIRVDMSFHSKKCIRRKKCVRQLQ